MSRYIERQNCSWVSHVCRASNDTLTKQLMFTNEKFTKIGGRCKIVLESVVKVQEEKFGKSAETFFRESIRR